MAKRDPRIDKVIEKANPFARPILRSLRQSVHAGCPSAVETIKWGMPFFLYKGKILAFMAPFKAHCRFGLWRGGPKLTQNPRIASVKELPPKKKLIGGIRSYMKKIDGKA